jgi:hypothetical protein|tara:strand:+ start:5924 stop:6781 length:858 start_codon:yes stop_codon:yes gene_type:complete
MNHPAEIALHQFMENASNGKSKFSDETVAQVGKDVMDAVKRQFGSSKPRGDFRLRMSNIGRPACQLWYDKNKPELALPFPTTFIMNMMLGDIVEAVFKGLLKEAGVKYEDSEEVTLNLPNADIKGTYDVVIDGSVDDIKSSSQWSYNNKFDSYASLKEMDGFGYIAQLAGYAKASGKKVGGWWVVNKANGDFKYVPATGLDVDDELDYVNAKIKKLNNNEFNRCFEPINETFRGKETGNTVLNTHCTFCSYRYDCWKNIKELPAVMSQAKSPKIVSYIDIKEEYL